MSPPDENPSGSGNFEFPLRFPGQYLDKETNLHYNYFRDYDSAIGRYAQSDLIGLAGGINTYAYANLNPLTFVDEEGLFAAPAGALATAIIVVAGAMIINQAAQNAQQTQEEPSRTIPEPKKPACGCTCICRADADDRIPGNIKPGLPKFAFGEATEDNCPKAVKEAKKRATHNLKMQPKHIPCKCAGR